jgi:hypothetical protein
MNIGQIKLLSWLGAGVLTAGLGYYVYSFVRGFQTLNRGVDPAEIDRVLQTGEPVQIKTEEVTNYEDIRRLILPSCEKCKTNPNCKHLNWTGAVKVVETTKEDEGPRTPPATPVQDLIHVHTILQSRWDPKFSSILLRYRNEARVTVKSPTNVFLLKVGDSLHAPCDYIRIDSIDDDGVTFAFKDAARPKETLKTKEFDAKTAIVEVGEDGIMRPKLTNPIPKGDQQVWNPERTTPLGNNKWHVGTEDAKEFAENWDSIIASQLRPERHKDPRTGKYDGIEITTVPAGSLAERHGAQSGDVIKSVNGHPVTSVSEAIQFVKTHKDQYTTWVVVIENKGRQRTQTYHSPQN